MFGANGGGSPLGDWRKDDDAGNSQRVDLNREVEGAIGEENAAPGPGPGPAASSSSDSSLESADNSVERNAESSFLKTLENRFQNWMTNPAGIGIGRTDWPQPTPEEKDTEIHFVKCMIERVSNLRKRTEEEIEQLEAEIEQMKAEKEQNQLLADVGVTSEGEDTPLDTF